MTDDVEQLGINVIRGLAMDAPQKANSGHPGTAMALAPLATVLWTRIMSYDPSDPEWPDRDRFILSAGHASILLYSMLHLTGYDLSLDDLKQFRQWGSRTPGHPEVRHTPGIEVTTGPLAQGFGNGVGMGIAERWMRARFGADICDHHTFVICGDGDLEEGLSHEAASLAGHLGLGRLIYVYDDNHITIDGPTDLSYSDNVAERFGGYGWDVNNLGEIANDTDAIEAGIRGAMATEDKPSLLILRSHIAYPSPHKTDTASAHGEPLGDDEVSATKSIMGLPADETFYVPQDVYDFYRRSAVRGQAANFAWKQRRATWSGNQAELESCLEGKGMDGWAAKLPTFNPGDSIATRVASADCLNAIADVVPALVGGAADLTGNTGVKFNSATPNTEASPEGRQIYFGVREHAMGSIMNGMSYHGGTIPFGGTFFVFSDYMRPAVRLAALAQAHVIYSWSHDSVGLGEDGPTHQPIEQLASLRAMPNLRILRPADANETAHAWRVAVDHDGPVALLLSRQKIPVLEGTAEALDGVLQGAYVLHDVDDPRVVLIGSGSEVHLCIDAARILAEEGVGARVVSMPSWDLFDELDADAQEDVLPSDIPTLAVEAGSPFGWERWADDVVAIDHYGASAPGEVVLAKFGFTPENVASRARALLEGVS